MSIENGKAGEITPTIWDPSRINFWHFWELLGPILHAAVNMAIQKGHFEKRMDAELISLIPKKDKDRTQF